MTNKLPADHKMLSTADDCHHGGINEWGFDGRNLYHRFKSFPRPRWNKIKKIGFTPARVKLLNQLISN